MVANINIMREQVRMCNQTNRIIRCTLTAAHRIQIIYSFIFPFKLSPLLVALYRRLSTLDVRETTFMRNHKYIISRREATTLSAMDFHIHINEGIQANMDKCIECIR